MRNRLVVAIDGPAGAGKSTASRRLAERLGYVLVDTGALYRAVALVARQRGVPWDDGTRLGELARVLKLRFERGAGEAPRLFVDNADVSADIRRPEISQGASIVSAHQSVRSALLEIQRTLGRDGGVVLEGRDIGTVVFPDAEVKIFLTASAEVRARRRHEELLDKGQASVYDTTLAAVRERDARDSNREVAPLKPAADAVVLDSSTLTLDAVVDQLAGFVQERQKRSSG